VASRKDKIAKIFQPRFHEIRHAKKTPPSARHHDVREDKIPAGTEIANAKRPDSQGLQERDGFPTMRTGDFLPTA
jgi:hypothetical protein